jgi:hypothetical protein
MSEIKSKIALLKIKADNYDKLVYQHNNSQNNNSQNNNSQNNNHNQLKIELLEKENQELKSNILKLSGNNSILVNKIKFLEQSIDNKSSDYYTKIEQIILNYQNKFNNSNNSNNINLNEYNELLKSYNDLQNKIKKNFNHFTCIIDEKEKIIINLNNEINSLKTDFTIYQDYQLLLQQSTYTQNINQVKMNNLMNELTQLNNEKEVLQDKLSYLVSNIDDYKDIIFCNNNEIKLLNKEVDKLESIIETRHKNYTITFQRNTILQNKCTKLVNDNILYLVNSSKEINEKNDIIEKLTKENETLNDNVSSYKKYLNSIGVCNVFNDNNIPTQNEFNLGLAYPISLNYNCESTKINTNDLDNGVECDLDNGVECDSEYDLEKEIEKNIESILNEWNLVRDDDYNSS